MIKKNSIIGPLRAQPDWNQSDENHLGYIKNKPFGSAALGEVVISEKTFQDGDYEVREHTNGTSNVYAVQVPYERIPEGWDPEYGAYEDPYTLENSLYTVTLDGIEYSNIPYQHIYSTYGYMGEGEPAPDSQYPFSVGIPYGGGGAWFINFATGGKHTIQVNVAGEIQKLDEKFIPDTIARVSDIQAYINSQIAALEEKIYTKSEVDALIQGINA